MACLLLGAAQPGAAFCVSSGPPCSSDPCRYCELIPHAETGPGLNLPDYGNRCQTFYVSPAPHVSVQLLARLCESVCACRHAQLQAPLPRAYSHLTAATAAACTKIVLTGMCAGATHVRKAAWSHFVPGASTATRQSKTDAACGPAERKFVEVQGQAFIRTG